MTEAAKPLDALREELKQVQEDTWKAYNHTHASVRTSFNLMFLDRLAEFITKKLAAHAEAAPAPGLREAVRSAIRKHTGCEAGCMACEYSASEIVNYVNRLRK